MNSQRPGLFSRTNERRLASFDFCVEVPAWFLAISASRGLLLENLLQVADFAPHLAARFFGCPAVAQVWISRRLAGLFFHFALRFLESALDFILCARFHKNKIARYERGGCKLVCN